MSEPKPGSLEDWSWMYRIVRYWVTVSFVLVAVALVFGPAHWEQSNSLEVLHDRTHIPWWVWGLVFFAVAAMLCYPRTRLAAWVAAIPLAGFFVAIAVLFTLLANKVTNPIIVLSSPLIVLPLLAGVRYEVILLRRRQPRLRRGDDE